MKDIRVEFLSETFQFLVVKFPIYLIRRVFVMGPENINYYTPKDVQKGILRLQHQRWRR